MAETNQRRETSDQRILERTHEDLANDVAVIASEFLGGLQKGLETHRREPSDQRTPERTHEDLANDVAVIASEFLGGFQKVLEIDRPAVTVFGSARVGEASRPSAQARGTAKLLAPAHPR